MSIFSDLKMRFLVLFFSLSATGTLLSGCKTEVTGTNSSSTVTTATTQFASGTKAVKIYTSNASISSGLVSASFDPTFTVPTATAIPSPFPGYDGTTTYLPGISAERFYGLDGTTNVISKPNWLLDFQLGVTSIPGTSTCATFGGSSVSLDVSNQYRVSEVNCGSVATGTGSSAAGGDPIFFRIILDRDTSKIGSAENLLIQVEYQASGLHFNADGNNANFEDNQDLLWKIFWSDELGSGSPKPFSVFVPPVYSACIPAGTGTTGTNQCTQATYRGSPIKVRQFLIPLAAYPDMKVIQFSRIKSRINTVPGTVTGLCTSSDSPLCLGVVIRSVSIMRI